MLTVSVNYLMGRAVAREYFSDASIPEWPPHPCRLFSAMVAGWADKKDKSEEDALEWLEKQKLPEIVACEVQTGKSPNLFSAPTGICYWNKRTKKFKFYDKFANPKIKTTHYFPRIALSNPNVFFIWKDVDEEDLAKHKPKLEKIVKRIPYLGNSMSPVTVSLCDSPPQSENFVCYVPKQNGELPIRVARKGRFEELCEIYERTGGNSMDIPNSRTFPYAKETEENEKTPPGCSKVFENDHFKAIVLSFTPDTDKDPQSQRAYLQHWMKPSDIVRKAMIAKADETGVSDEAKEIISGHPADSRGKTEKPHLARIPLANIGWKHSDGKLLGCALILPNRCGNSVFQEVRKVAKEVKNLTVGGFGVWNVEVVDDPEYEGRKSLDLSRYFKPSSKFWTTVTPVLFDDLPNRPNSNQSYRILHGSFSKQGLPEPVFGKSRQLNHAVIKGVPRSQDFNIKNFRKPGDRRPWTHLTVEFEEPVAGPVIVGALRFFGLGLMMPVFEN